jgi:hypothetical protein
LAPSLAGAAQKFLTLTGDPAPGTAADFQTFGNVLINEAGQLAFEAELDTLRPEWGIWKDRGTNGLELVVRLGDPAPGTTNCVFGGLDLYGYNALEEVLFMGTLNGPGVDSNNNRGIWIQTGGRIELVVRGGNPAPGLPGPYFAVLLENPGGPVLNNLGQIAFFAVLSDGQDFWKESLWVGGAGGLRLVVAAGIGMQAAGTDPGVVFQSLGGSLSSLLNDWGETLFHATLSGPGVTHTNNTGIWLGRVNALRLVVRSGMPVPGEADAWFSLPADGTTLGLSQNSLVFAGEAYGPTVPRHGRIWKGPSSGTTMTTVAKVGDPAPGISFTNTGFTQLVRCVVNRNGQVTFGARVYAPELGMFEGIWSEGAGALELVAHEGMVWPEGTRSFYAFANLTMNSSGRLGFVAQSDRFASSVWETDAVGGVFSPFRPEGTVAVATNDVRTILDVYTCSTCGWSGGSDGRGRIVAENGNVALRLTMGRPGLITSQGVLVLQVDSDGDGLWDHWERNGIRLGSEGGVVMDLPGWGANPLHKDLFVEVDAMDGRAPFPQAISNVVDAFKQAPADLVNNPDGQPGIKLHVTLSDTNVPLAVWGANVWEEYDLIKTNYFGTAAERSRTNEWPLIKKARAQVFRYCVFAHNQIAPTNSTSGRAEIVGNDFMVTLGNWLPPGGDTNQQAGTFMHELGHTLGLRHGGADNLNYTQNYYSVMNYLWQTPHAGLVWRLDYSRETMPPLNKASLDETVGIGGQDSYLQANGVLTPYRNGLGAVRWAPMWAANAVDWDGDGRGTNTSVAVDINFFDPSRQAHSTNEVLSGHEDWSSLHLALSGSTDFLDGAHLTAAGSEMTFEEWASLEAILAGLSCRLQIERQGANVILRWQCSARLYTAPAVQGPWSEVVNAASPYEVAPAGTAAFFALFQRFP